MDLIFCKTSCSHLLLLLMLLLVSVHGASVRSSVRCLHSRNESLLEDKHMVPLELDPKLLTPLTSISALNNISISPWTFRESNDSSLFPAVLQEAQCVLQGCRNALGQEDMRWQSRPILRETLVLRRVRCASGDGYHFRLETRLVAVGCTCVQPHVRHQH